MTTAKDFIVSAMECVKQGRPDDALTDLVGALRNVEPTNAITPDGAKALLECLMSKREGDGWSFFEHHHFLESLNIVWPVRYDVHHNANVNAWADLLCEWGTALKEWARLKQPASAR